MDQRVKKLWIDALRSGDYKQGRECLRTNDNEFCCLGVLCDLYGKENKVDWDPEDGGSRTFYKQISFLPNKVKDWADFETIENLTGILVEMNDQKMNSFWKIADYIETL